MKSYDKLKEYFDTLVKTNRQLSNLIDIEKIQFNVEDILINLNTLNYILDSDETKIKEKINILFNKDSEIFNVFLLLLGIKNKDFLVYYNNEEIKINSFLKSPELIFELIKKTKFIDLITTQKIKNFVDYFTGLEVGIDTNSRKNRTGKITEINLENEIENIIINTKWTLNKQVKIDLQIYMVDIMVFDFVISNLKENKKILIKTSFYNSNCSKISETAESLKLINDLLKNESKFKFIWVADGVGMKSISKILEGIISEGFIMNKKQFLEWLKKEIKK